MNDSSYLSRPYTKPVPNTLFLNNRSFGLGHWLKHYITSQRRQIDGAGDHLVSEALYLSDPEGNGLEVYHDRPRESWQYDGQRIKMASLAVDLPALVAAAPNTAWQGMPAGTTLGHVHLQVHDVAQVVSFYRDIWALP